MDRGDVADERAPSGRIEVADVVGGMAGRVRDFEPVYLLATGKWPQVFLRHRGYLTPEAVHLVAVEASRAGEQLRGIDEVGSTNFVDIDLELGPAPHECAGGARVVQVDVCQEQRLRLFLSELLD